MLACCWWLQVLDGPVDHVWVEALNPVLDDNHTLCLSSGETVPLREGINLVMEVRALCVCVCVCMCAYFLELAPMGLAHGVSSELRTQRRLSSSQWVSGPSYGVRWRMGAWSRGGSVRACVCACKHTHLKCPTGAGTQKP